MLPSKSKQVEAVMKFLDSDKNEGRSLEEIATDIVDGYLDAITSGIKKPIQPPREGMLYKHASENKVWRVSWLRHDGLAWLTSETSAYGFLGRISDDYWQYAEEYRPKKRVTVDGKGTLVELTDEDIAEAWSNPDWKIGDKLSRSQRFMSFEVIAVAPNTVLLMGNNSQLYSESNSNLKRYYRREIEMGNVEW